MKSTRTIQEESNVRENLLRVVKARDDVMKIQERQRGESKKIEERALREKEELRIESTLVEDLAKILKEEEMFILGELAESHNCLIVPQLQSQETLFMRPFLPPEIFMHIAPHLPAKDQHTLGLLNKNVRKEIPKVLLLNYRYFPDSFTRLVDIFQEENLISEIPVQFTLDPKEVELNPYGVLALVQNILEEEGGKYRYDYTSTFIHALLGPSLKVAVPEIMKRSHKHPNFKHLTLPIAAFANCPEAVQFLLSSRKKTVIPDSNRALQMACQGGFSDVVKLLLQDTRIDPTLQNNLPIYLAARQGHVSTFKLLIEDPRISPEAGDDRCIRDAAEHGYVELIQLLLQDARVDWKVQNFETLRMAHKNNHPACLKLLLDHFVAHPGGEGEDAHIDFSHDERIELVKILQVRCDFHSESNNFKSLRWAHLNSYHGIVKKLLDNFIRYY